MARLLTSPRLRLALLAVLAVGTAATLVAGGPSSGEIERAVGGGGIAEPLAYIALYPALTPTPPWAARSTTRPPPSSSPRSR